MQEPNSWHPNRRLFLIADKYVSAIQMQTGWSKKLFYVHSEFYHLLSEVMDDRIAEDLNGIQLNIWQAGYSDPICK